MPLLLRGYGDLDFQRHMSQDGYFVRDHCIVHGQSFRKEAAWRCLGQGASDYFLQPEQARGWKDTPEESLAARLQLATARAAKPINAAHRGLLNISPNLVSLCTWSQTLKKRRGIGWCSSVS